MVVLEPASISHDRGLATAIERGEAGWLAPGEAARYRISLSVDSETTPVRHKEVR
jgi:hypothetical protein